MYGRAAEECRAEGTAQRVALTTPETVCAKNGIVQDARMTARKHLLTLIMALSVLAPASARAQPGRDGGAKYDQYVALAHRFDDRVAYLCCTLRFDRDGNATDANLNYPFADSILVAGTRVHASVTVANSRPKVVLKVPGRSREFAITLEYSLRRISPVDYFAKVLVEEDPWKKLGTVPAEIGQAIRQGRLLVGMTKEQALMARGYPPLHQTPDLKADEWLYYFSNGLVDSVRFTGNRIIDMERGPAP